MQCFGHHYGENDYSVIFLFFIDCYIIDYLEFFSDKFSACPAYSFSVHVLSEFTLFQCKHNIKFHRVWHLSPASFYLQSCYMEHYAHGVFSHAQCVNRALWSGQSVSTTMFGV